MRGSGHGPEGPDIEPGSYDTTSLRARGAIAAALNPCASLIDAAQMRPEVCVGASVADIHSHEFARKGIEDHGSETMADGKFKAPIWVR